MLYNRTLCQLCNRLQGSRSAEYGLLTPYMRLNTNRGISLSIIINMLSPYDITTLLYLTYAISQEMAQSVTM